MVFPWLPDLWNMILYSKIADLTASATQWDINVVLTEVSPKKVAHQKFVKA